MARPGGIILCGGRSRRMGRPKADLPFGPETMLARVARLLAEAADPIVVVAATGQVLPELPRSIRVVRDPVADRGPLQGLAAGFEALGDEVELAYATSTDAPFLHPAWVDRLVSLIGEHDLAIPEVGDQLHPLAAVYRVRTARPAAGRLLADGQLRLGRLAETLSTLRIDAPSMTLDDPDLLTLRNLNTLDDYRWALQSAGLE